MGDFRTVWKHYTARHGNRAQRPQHAYPPQLQVAGTFSQRSLVSFLNKNENDANETRHSWTWQRMTASLIGCLGQAHFPSFFWVMVTHPGHASLRSLVDAIMAPLQAYVGSAVESLALRRASGCAADIFGFFHEPRPVRDDPVRIGWVAF